MHLSDELRLWFIEIASTHIFQQVAPLFVLLAIPTLVLLVASNVKRSSFLTVMGLESLGLTLPWSWWSSSSGAPNGSPIKSLTRDRKKAKKHVRTRAEQMEMNGLGKHHSGSEGGFEDDQYYPGLVNISGTYCFMNSTLQALASLSYLQPHIDAIYAKAEAVDVPTPVIDALKELFQELNTPRSSYHAIRPTNIIEVLSKQTEGRSNTLFYSREHQDAQELFQLVSECIKNELGAVDKEAARDRGLGGLSQAPETAREIGKSVFDGLTANRRSCTICGYTEAVMHFAFDNWQLSVPRLAGGCRLEDCLEDYTRLEILKDCICRKCSLVSTHHRLQYELATLEEATKPENNPSNSKKRRLKEVKKLEARVKAALAQGRIEEDLKDVRMEKVFSSASTKQAMIARPPPVLALHLNRSIHYGQYASKNTCRVVFPEVLDLTPYTTSGSLSTVPTAAISTPPPPLPRSTTPTPSTYETLRTIYRLSAVVCHYGGHSFGHYICYRRKPRSPNVGKEKRFLPPKLVDPLRAFADNADDDGTAGSESEYVWEGGDTPSGKGWLRISDDSVQECGIETVLTEGSGVFMLYYERAVQDRPGIYPSLSTPRASEETLRPELKTVDLNGSVGSLVSEVGVGVLRSSSKAGKDGETSKSGGAGIGGSVGGSQILGPRIVRSVAAGRSRSASAQPPSLSEKGSSSVASLSSSLQIDSRISRTISVTSSSSSGLANGNARHDLIDSDPLNVMSASAPSLIILRDSSISKPSATSTLKTNSSLPGPPSKPPLNPPAPAETWIHSPQPHRPPSPPAIADLKA